jgi:hypothetical protein
MRFNAGDWLLLILASAIAAVAGSVVQLAIFQWAIGTATTRVVMALVSGTPGHSWLQV